MEKSQKEGIYDYCNTRYEDLVAIRTPRNEKLREANEEALQVYKRKDFPWPKSASVKYPLITNACIDFASRIFPAIWQDGDVVKTKFYKQHPDYAAGERLSRYLNYYLAERVPGWVDNLDKLTTAYPINGLMLKKVYFDPEAGAVRSDLVFPQDLFVPNEAATLKDAPYYFHRYTTTRRNIISFIRTGIWDAKEEDFKEDDMGTNDLPTNASVRAEDKTPSAFSDVFEAIEGYIVLDLDHDGYPEPFIVTFVPKVGQVVRIVPRFQADSITYSEDGKVVRIEPDEYFVEYQFDWYLICLGSSQESVDEDGRCFGIVDGNNQHTLVEVGGQYMRLFRQVGCASDDVVLAVFYLTDKSSAFVVHDDLHIVAHRNGVGTPDTLQTEIAFDFAIHQFPVFSLYLIPASCILDN